ncbi:YhgE/Pip domain-containing protein [Niallia sp. 03133]|uniref:YhgE/Pip domain-containing protein n=1 Tax=Niallia sp. 03133 TaxID=3458060 RepID=UPI004043E9CF
MFKQKIIALTPIIVIAVMAIFSLTFIPSIHPAPKNLPIAIVNADKGADFPNQTKVNLGENIVSSIKKASNAKSNDDPAIKWIQVDNEKQVKSGLNNQDYYAALIIPSDFSQKQLTLQTENPSLPSITLYVNQGMNYTVSNIAVQILNGVVANINSNIRDEALKNYEKAGMTLTTQQVSTLFNPIKTNLINVNKVGSHSANGNAPVSLFQPVWMASLIGSVLVFLGLQKTILSNRKAKLLAKLMQVVIGLALSLIVGFGLTWFADGVLGLEVPQLFDTALFISITYLSFYFMISALMSWIGFIAIPISALTLFFGAPLLAMAPELMPAFYKDWIHPWLPMRFMVDGLRELFFFHKGLSWNHPVAALTGIGIVSLIILFVSVLKPAPKKKEEKVAVTDAEMI